MEILYNNFIKTIPDSSSIGFKGRYDIIFNYYLFHFKSFELNSDAYKAITNMWKDMGHVGFSINASLARQFTSWKTKGFCFMKTLVIRVVV